MTPFELTTFITAVANLIAREQTASDLALLAAIFTQLGDTLATIVTLTAEIDDAQSSDMAP